MIMKDLKDKRILLIGGAGFIGHNLAVKLKEQGADVQIIDGLQVNNLLSFASSADNVPNRELYLHLINERLNLLRENKIPMHVIDARDYHSLCRITEQFNPNIVVHLAAISHAKRANKDPFSTFDHNLRTLENALDATRERVEQFIYLSSSMVYGNFKEPTVTEDMHCEPLGIYGALKFAGEKLVIAYNQVFDLPFTIIRPSALYGERCVSRRVGQIFIENAVRGLGISIDGDGSDRLDFTYIDDFVHGVVQSIKSPKAINEIFNITYGSSRSISDMVEILKKHFPDLSVTSNPRDRLMPFRGTLSVDKAKELIGYDPQWPLEKGFVEYIKWYRTLFENGGGKLVA